MVGSDPPPARERSELARSDRRIPPTSEARSGGDQVRSGGLGVVVVLGDFEALGHHRFSGVGRAVGPVNLGAELWVDRDQDPSGHVTQASFDLTAAWTPKALKDVQLDASAYVGLNRRTPDLELVVGMAHRF